MKWPRFQFGLVSVFGSVTLLSVFLVLDTRPSSPKMIGHVELDSPQFRPGIWILGYEYGWPWTYRRESFKVGSFVTDHFDKLDWYAFAANMGVAITLSAVGGWLADRAILATTRSLRRAGPETETED